MNFALLKETSFIPKCEFRFSPRCRLWTVNHAAMIWHVSKWKMRTKSIENSLYVKPLMSFGNIYCVHVQNKIVQESASKKQTIYKKLELLVLRLLVCGLTSSSRIFLSWRRHHRRWRAANWRPHGLSARRDYCRATPAVTPVLGFWNSRRRTNLKDWIVVAIFRVYWSPKNEELCIDI